MYYIHFERVEIVGAINSEDWGDLNDVNDQIIYGYDKFMNAILKDTQIVDSVCLSWENKEDPSKRKLTRTIKVILWKIVAKACSNCMSGVWIYNNVFYLKFKCAHC